MRMSQTWGVLLSGLIGGLLFIALFGYEIVNPQNIQWLLKADYTQHYLGWLFFRNESWSFPPGIINNLIYPHSTSIVYTDSIPFVAITLKLISPLLNQDFQYAGLWLLASYVLQGIFGYLCLSQWTRSKFCPVLGSVFFSISPILIHRVDQLSLSAHWIVLASIWVYFLPHSRRSLFGWLFINTLAITTHPYLAVITLTIATAFFIKVNIQHKNTLSLSLLKQFFLVVTAAIFAGIISGLFIPIIAQYGGFHIYSTDLLALINPMGYSKVLPTLESIPYQYEGFAYLGAGMILLCVLALTLVYKKKSDLKRYRWISIMPLFIVSTLLLIFSMSDIITLNGKTVITLIDLYVPIEPLTLIFRAPGRFIWPFYYVLMIFVISFYLRYLKETSAMIIVGTALLIQIYDVHEAYNRVSSSVSSKGHYTEMSSPKWSSLDHRISEVHIVPPYLPYCNSTPEPDADAQYVAIALFAAKHNAAINSGYTARMPASVSPSFCNSYMKRLLAGNFRNNVLYFIENNLLYAKLTIYKNLICKHIDDFNVCYVR